MSLVVQQLNVTVIALTGIPIIRRGNRLHIGALLAEYHFAALRGTRGKYLGCETMLPLSFVTPALAPGASVATTEPK